MALRLSDWVLAGEIYNNHPKCVHGRLLVKGFNLPILVELVGDPAPDLKGRAFRFEVPENDRPLTPEAKNILKGFRDRQIGATGTMTAAEKRRVFINPSVAYDMDKDLVPPSRWVDCLYLEWYSQNGRVVIELPEPKLQWIDLGAPEPAEEDEEPFPTFEIHDDPTDEIWRPEPLEESEFQLIPDDLLEEIEASSRETDAAIAEVHSDEVERPSAEKEMEDTILMDDLIENGKGVGLGSLFEPEDLPLPEDLKLEHEAELALKLVAGRLALFNIGFSVCKHCSWQEAYRIFHEKVCPEGEVFLEMRNTGWVQHFSTHDYCPKCEEGLEP